MQKIAGIIFIAVSALAGVVASMTTVQLSDAWTYGLFGLCGLIFMVGLALMLWRKPSAVIKDSSAHIEIGSAGHVVLEDNFISGPLYKGEKLQKFEARRNTTREPH